MGLSNDLWGENPAYVRSLLSSTPYLQAAMANRSIGFRNEIQRVVGFLVQKWQPSL